MLKSLLVNDKNVVQLVGSQHNGSLSDGCEGYPGYIISQVSDKGKTALPIYRPNVVTLLVGTNDMKYGYASGAPERLGNLTDLIFSSAPDATLLVSKLPPNTVAATNDLILTYNKALEGVVKARADKGKHILLVDNYSPIKVPDDMSDDTHTNDVGYVKIANVWYKGLQVAVENGWIKDPVAVPSSTTLVRVTATGDAKAQVSP